MSSSSANGREPVPAPPDNIDAELALWKQLLFDTDMAPQDKQPAPDNDSNRPYFQAAPPQLPPETYAYLIQALLSLQGSASHASPQTYPPTYPHPTLPNYNYPWPPNTAPPIPAASTAAPSSFYSTDLPPRAIPQNTGSVQLVPSPATSASAEQDPDGTEDATSITDDKRRRNTAASARFRVKRKLKTLSLERTVADLAGRTEELDREANDLRRENAWLKEIVLLRGRNLAPLNLGSQAPAPANRHSEDEKDDRTHAGSGLESTVRGKGKDKEC